MRPRVPRAVCVVLVARLLPDHPQRVRPRSRLGQHLVIRRRHRPEAVPPVEVALRHHPNRGPGRHPLTDRRLHAQIPREASPSNPHRSRRGSLGNDRSTPLPGNEHPPKPHRDEKDQAPGLDAATPIPVSPLARLPRHRPRLAMAPTSPLTALANAAEPAFRGTWLRARSTAIARPRVKGHEQRIVGGVVSGAPHLLRRHRIHNLGTLRLLEELQSAPHLPGVVLRLWSVRWETCRRSGAEASLPCGGFDRSRPMTSRSAADQPSEPRRRPRSRGTPRSRGSRLVATVVCSAVLLGAVAGVGGFLILARPRQHRSDAPRARLHPFAGALLQRGGQCTGVVDDAAHPPGAPMAQVAADYAPPEIHSDAMVATAPNTSHNDLPPR